MLCQVLSKDSKISGDEGWWTGKIHGKVGIFPANFVAEAESIDRVSSVIDKVQPIEIDFEELQLEEVIGVGGFGKVYRCTIQINLVQTDVQTYQYHVCF